MGFIMKSDALRSWVPSRSVEMAIDLTRVGNGHPLKRDLSHLAKISGDRVSWVIVRL